MKIRWGMIGTGDVTERKSGPALYLAERSELIGVTNRTRERAQRWSSRHGDPQVYDSAEALLANAQINAVYVATPPSTHAEYTALAARAGKHVLCEKPMAMSVDECRQMITVCQEHNVSLSIAFYRRYFPVVQKMKELVDAGAVGRVLRISAKTIAPFSPPNAEPWRLDAAVAGGGFLMDMGTHRFDLFNYFVGSPSRVLGVVGTQSLDTVVDDVASVAMEFADGVQGSASFHWNCPVGRDELEIVGTEGILTTDSLSGAGRLTLETRAGRELWALPSSLPVHLNLVQRVVDHLLDGAPNPCSGESGMVASEMVEAIYHSQ